MYVNYVKTSYARHFVYVFFFISFTGPPSPQNITAGPVTVTQITVHWVLTGAQPKASWTFVVHYMDVDTSQERIVGMGNISKTSGLQQYTAVIGGLESYRKYRIEVFTVTQHGILSCEQESVTVQTGEQMTLNIFLNDFLKTFCSKKKAGLHLMTLLLLCVQWNSDSWSARTTLESWCCWMGIRHFYLFMGENFLKCVPKIVGCWSLKWWVAKWFVLAKKGNTFLFSLNGFQTASEGV